MALLGDTPANTDLLTLPDDLFGFSSGVGPVQRTANDVYEVAQPSVGIIATNIADTPPSGRVGEFKETLVATGAAVSLVSGTAKTIATLSSPGSGDFDVFGIVTLKYNAATQSADGQAGISGTTNTLPTDGSEGYDNTRHVTTTANVSITLPRKRISQSSNNSIFLVAQATFSAGTCTAFGEISARRVR